jgi:uncharacterized protein with HEPN domain
LLNIKGYDFSGFQKDYRTVDAVIRNFEVIGEASRNLSDKIKNQYPGIPWNEMYYLRNRVAHEYFGIDYKIIWDIAKIYLPDNKAFVDQIIEQFGL